MTRLRKLLQEMNELQNNRTTLYEDNNQSRFINNLKSSNTTQHIYTKIDFERGAFKGK